MKTIKTIKTSIVVVTYNLLKNAKLGEMKTEDKFNIIKTIKAMKGVTEEFESFRSDAAERLRGDNHEEMMKKASVWRSKGDKCGFADDEKREINAYFEKYGEDLNACILEEADKENEVDVRMISEEAFGNLLDANPEWKVEEIIVIEDILCE